MPPSNQTPVLLDTDIGSDIDDALALTYLLAHPQCELVGITTVTGDVAKRAALAEWICSVAGRNDVPIFPGLASPLLLGPGQPFVPQYDAIEDTTLIDRYRDVGAYRAISFLSETIRSRPGEITLLAIGPMTNIATLFTYDPELIGMLKQVVFMCGAFGLAEATPGLEWNSICDPVASAIAFRQAKNLLSVGLDVTMKCQATTDECRQKFGTHQGPTEVILKMAEVWFRDNELVTFHDPLAAANIFLPDLCMTDIGTVEVTTNLGPELGKTSWRSHGGGDHSICTSVDPVRFFNEYFSVVAC